jgi:predicted RNase H-like HicB family nuclease
VCVMKQIKIIIEKHSDGYVAYPVGIKGVVVGEGDTYEEALKEVQSALKFHIDTFGADIADGKAIGQGESDGYTENTR